MKDYWLFTIAVGNEYTNCFFDCFPSKKKLKAISKGRNYAIIHTMRLTQEQFNKLTEEE